MELNFSKGFYDKSKVEEKSEKTEKKIPISVVITESDSDEKSYDDRFRMEFTKKWEEATSRIRNYSVSVKKKNESCLVFAKEGEKEDIAKTASAVQYRGKGRKMRYV